MKQDNNTLNVRSQGKQLVLFSGTWHNCYKNTILFLMNERFTKYFPYINYVHLFPPLAAVSLQG